MKTQQPWGLLSEVVTKCLMVSLKDCERRKHYSHLQWITMFDAVDSRQDAVLGESVKNLGLKPMIDPRHKHYSKKVSGMSGCWGSHYKIWQMLADEPKGSRYFIMEDDASAFDLNRLYNWDYDINHRGEKKYWLSVNKALDGDIFLNLNTRNGWRGTEAYLISTDMAKRLISKTAGTMRMPVDLQMHDMAGEKIRSHQVRLGPWSVTRTITSSSDFSHGNPGAGVTTPEEELKGR